MAVWHEVALWGAFSCVLVACGSGDPPPDGGMDSGRADSGPADSGPADSGATLDGGVSCSVAECSLRLGFPPVPDHPCGHCWAECRSDGECGVICFEAATCIFTAGCGPACEPLCDTTADCLLDDVCVDGVCVMADGGAADAGPG